MTCPRPRCRGRLRVGHTGMLGRTVIRYRYCDVCGFATKTTEQGPAPPPPKRPSVAPFQI